jgi:hypothetical protein
MTHKEKMKMVKRNLYVRFAHSKELSIAARCEKSTIPARIQGLS